VELAIAASVLHLLLCLETAVDAGHKLESFDLRSWSGATPRPLLIGIPVAFIRSISFAAKRPIVVRDPEVLEVISTC
jgi:hypothetical protein